MASIQANVILHTKSGVQKDFCQNSFVFSSVGGAVEDLCADVADSLQAFYVSIQQWISPVIERTGTPHEIVMYDILGELAAAGSGIGSPVVEPVLFSIGAPLVNFGLPAEVALCLSFRSNIAGAPVEGPGNTRPRSRRTGRVYLGPLVRDAASESSATAATRPNESLKIDVVNAATALMDETNHFWCVWSRVDNQLRTVQGGWVDNAFDTQRRRGPDTTTRNIFGT